MEFEDLKQIWDTQNQKVLYAIDEKAMHKYIATKKRRSVQITQLSEVLLIAVNAGVGLFILVTTLIKPKGNISLSILALWLFGSAFYVVINRLLRIKGNRRFDRSMRGDLDHSIAVASYQVRLSQIMRWNIVPIGVLTVFGIWEGGKPVWIAVFIMVSFALAHYMSGWEHGIYKAKKRELEVLQKKLQQD